MHSNRTGQRVSDAFSYLRTRQGLQVQEYEILRVAANIEGDDPILAMQTAKREALVWVKNRAGGQLPPAAWDGGSFDCLVGGRTTLAVSLNGEGFELWAVRGDDPDKDVARRVWTTEISIGRSEREKPRLSLRQLVITDEGEFTVNPHVPGLLQQISKRCGLSVGGYSALPIPFRVSNEQSLNELILMLEDSRRNLPVLVVSGDERSSDSSLPLLDVDSLAKATLGIAHVATVPADLTYRLSDHFGRARSVYHGGARLYLPGFDASSNPFEHILFLGDAIKKDPGETTFEIRSIIAMESIRRSQIGKDVLPFATVRSAALKAEQALRVREGASEADQLEIAQRRVDALEIEVNESRSEAKQSFELALSEEERARSAEAQLNAARARIHLLESRLTARGDETDEPETIPKTWEELAEWCDRTLVGRLALASAARRGVRKPEFQDVNLISRCLVWLADNCRKIRISGGGSLSNIPIDQGIENAPCGTDQFSFEYQGRRLTADWHIKNGGNTRDPKICFRIYYTYDEMTQQIIVADMPAHRKTAAS